DLVVAGRGGREAGALTGVRAIPRVDQQIGERVRRVFQQVVLAIAFAVLDLANLAADRDQRIDESIQLEPRLALRRLDHQRARDRKRDGRWVEAVVDQALRDVLD